MMVNLHNLMECCIRLYTEIVSPGFKEKSRGSISDTMSADYVTTEFKAWMVEMYEGSKELSYIVCNG